MTAGCACPVDVQVFRRPKEVQNTDFADMTDVRFRKRKYMISGTTSTKRFPKLEDSLDVGGSIAPSAGTLIVAK